MIERCNFLPIRASHSINIENTDQEVQQKQTSEVVIIICFRNDF